MKGQGQPRSTGTDQNRPTRTNTDGSGPTRTATGALESVLVRVRPCLSVSSAELAANGALSLLNVCCYLLGRQIGSLGKKFVEEGGFTERLCRVRSQRRGKG